MDTAILEKYNDLHRLISFEVRTNINGILGLFSLILEDKGITDAKKMECFDLIRGNTKRVSDLLHKAVKLNFEIRDLISDLSIYHRHNDLHRLINYEIRLLTNNIYGISDFFLKDNHIFNAQFFVDFKKGLDKLPVLIDKAIQLNQSIKKDHQG